jgi:hypothetical protein
VLLLKKGVLLPALVVALVVGCAPDPVGPVVPVTGKVLLDGGPLTTGAVVFHPDANKGNATLHEPRGQVDAQGNYTIFTADRAGAPPGWYRVSVISQTSTATEENPYSTPTSNIAAKYGDPNTSGLVVEVKAEADPSAYNLKVTK